MEHVLDYIMDDEITTLLIDRAIAYIDEKGAVCCYDVEDEAVREIVLALQNSEVAFGGQYYGIRPAVIEVDQASVEEKLAMLRSKTQGSGQVRKIDASAAAQKLQRLLQAALAQGASDIHIINVLGERTEINVRIDGDFKTLRDQDASYGEEIVTYAVMNLGEGRDYSITGYADATFNVRLTETKRVGNKERTVERETSWRLAQIPVTKGSKVTIRNIDGGGGKVPNLNELGLGVGHIDVINGLFTTGQGAVIMSGPTGSGKTTLINAALQLVPPTRFIHALEDPPEWHMKNRNAVQTKVDESLVDSEGNKPRGFFANSVRLLRHDTDVVFFGEIREASSAKQFMRMSETGQLCVGTLHTNSAASSISTLVEQMSVSSAQLSSPGVLRALAHQRLVKKLCDKCSFSYEEALEKAPKIYSIKQSLENIEKLGIPADKTRFRNPEGCAHCGGEGELSRTAIFEVIVVDGAVRTYIRKMDLNGLLEHIKGLGWPSIREHAISKVQLGVIDVAEAVKKVDELIPIELENIYKDMLGVPNA
ncbi:GspE/PulE family protein [Vibrio barjaei]|uniref:GspE/PulE family protein n=1 Tax=Vibrio barjaei TaxID=1676683 RepID=UPI0022838BE3|nr:ATPase, T2SS/T4P/T4SS family [Vibrio barjaei]MCY9872983.1 ATPase, T2SS/T4P/T4SS family [Vibrio barjaei]